jgi:hypothetical protein
MFGDWQIKGDTMDNRKKCVSSEKPQSPPEDSAEVFRRDTPEGQKVVVAYHSARTKQTGPPNGYLTFTIKKWSAEEEEVLIDMIASVIADEVARRYREEKAIMEASGLEQT